MVPSQSELDAILGAAKRFQLALDGYGRADDWTLPRLIVAVRKMQAALADLFNRPLKWRNGATITIRKSKASVPRDVARGLTKLHNAVNALVHAWPFINSRDYQGAWPLVPEKVAALVDDAVALLERLPANKPAQPIAGELPARRIVGGKKPTTVAEANAIMMRAIEDDPERTKWSSRKWASFCSGPRKTCSNSTITQTSMYSQCAKAREQAKRDRMAPNRGRRKPRHYSNS